ncbi:MAG: hypothetical protein E7414_00130 [Ruminococcaceae bacterium]|nr:hypothetical protein [Oscillospiraceae bacterium]
MNKNILGIDLGTSSVKIMLYRKDGTLEKARAPYLEKTPFGWMQAIKEAFAQMPDAEIDAIGLSSQVGTYIVNGEAVISWNEGTGKQELEYIKKKYPKELFIEEIAMPHPDIFSYPIPRLLYIKNHYDNINSICQPKDLICKELTGRCVTDKYSWRGLAHTVKGEYSEFFLKEIGIDKNVLPQLVNPDDVVGVTTEECELKFGIPKGVPVYAGLNDFFSSLIGMGIKENGDMFDVTGTSEHLGIIQKELIPDTKMVSGVYFDQFIHYGVTASSGASLDFGIKNFGLEELCIEECLKHSPPIFTPYLNGERAPLFDSDARGVFFGISSSCSREDMAYSVMEGVVFSLYHIYESMGFPPCSKITVSGGAARNHILNRLKAELFNTNVYTLEENDTSVLGAIKVVASALGECADDVNKISGVIKPDEKYRDILLKRYTIYKSIYPSLKEQFDTFSTMKGMI